MRRKDKGAVWLVVSAAILIAVLAVIAYAWIGGGRVPLRTIVEPASPQTSRKITGVAAHSSIAIT